ncbi:MAG: type II secretion system protein [Candidatus Moranbacteria bacterium]|nr:type II secretion system protein [Candidatus Moranbacteria bacterium]
MKNKETELNNKRGFTLIEMLLAIAILVVLSGAILISISAQRDKARVTRTLSEMSAIIQPIEMCLADGGTVAGPSEGGDICNLSSRYGQWPVAIDGFSAYWMTGSWTGNNWFFNRQQTSSGTYVCCAATWLGCKIGTVANCSS